MKDLIYIKRIQLKDRNIYIEDNEDNIKFNLPKVFYMDFKNKFVKDKQLKEEYWRMILNENALKGI